MTPTITFRLRQLAIWLNTPANADTTIAITLATATFIAVLWRLALPA